MPANKHLSFSIAALLALASVARAQEPASSPGIFVGTRVRVFAPDLRSDRYVGRVDSLDGTTMVLDTAGARIRMGLDMGPVLVDQYRKVAIRIASIERIEISGGRTVRAATARGVALGAIIGGIVWGLGNLPEINPSAKDFVRGFPVGAIVGGVVGGAVGYGLGGESWLPARVPR